MAKRLVCCPNLDNKSFEYLYVDTSKLLVENVTKEVSALVKNAKDTCCFDGLVQYALGDTAVPEQVRDILSFDLYKLHSFELFKTTDELRFKTGSEKILSNCLLNYYRREYDGTQQHTYFSDPGYSNTFVSTGEGVEHELTLENREFIRNKQEDIGELETLDKGKTDAEREAEAALAQAEAEQMAAMSDAEEAEKKAQKRKKAKAKRQRIQEEERYREFRNQDDVQREEFRRLRQYEEEMRNNNASLSAQYDAGNYSSLPGVMSNDDFANLYETGGKETLGVAVLNDDLYRLASRMDEFGVPYTVASETLSNGQQISHILYSSDYAERGDSAKDFFTLESNLYHDNIVDESTYFNAFQLSALEYAYDNNVDTFYVQNGDFNGNQMFRIIDAGLNGLDMSVLSNPAYTTPQMDALTYYMNYGWDTTPISEPGISYGALADGLLQQEVIHNISREDSFFERHNYDSFLSYNTNGEATSFFNTYDDVQKEQYYKQIEKIENTVASQEAYDTFKENLHSSYLQRQEEMNYIGRTPGVLPSVVDSIASNSFGSVTNAAIVTGSVAGSAIDNATHNISKPDVMYKYIDPETEQVRTIPKSQVTPELVARCENYWRERDKVATVSQRAIRSNEVSPSEFSASNKSHVPGSTIVPGINALNVNKNNGEGILNKAADVKSHLPNSAYTPSGRVNSDGTFVPNKSGSRTMGEMGAIYKPHVSGSTIVPGGTGINVSKNNTISGLNNNGDNKLRLANSEHKTLKNSESNGIPVLYTKGTRLPSGMGSKNNASTLGNVSKNSGAGVLNKGKGNKPYSPTSAYTPSGRINSQGSFVPNTPISHSFSSLGLVNKAGHIPVNNVGFSKPILKVNKNHKTSCLNNNSYSKLRLANPERKTPKSSESNGIPVLHTKGTHLPSGVGSKNKTSVTGNNVLNVKKNNNNSKPLSYRSPGGGGGNGPNGPDGPDRQPKKVASNKVPFRRTPLDELKVRSAFAKRAGYKIQSYGRCLSNSALNITKRIPGKVMSADETSTVSGYRSITNVVSNVSMSAGLVMDMSRQFSRIGQRVRFGSAIGEKYAQRYGNGKFKTLTSRAAEKDIELLQRKQRKTISKLYGVKVAQMNIREINSNIKKFTKKIDTLHNSNSVLRGEIESLYKKKRAGKLSTAETKALRNKIKAYNKNNAKISKKKRDIRKLNKVKKLKKEHQKAIKKARKNAAGLGDKERNWRRAPSILMNSFVNMMHKAGNDAGVGSFATASSFAMGYIRSPIRKVAHGAFSLLVGKPVKKIAKKIYSKTKLYKKARARKFKKIRKKIRKYKKRQVRIQKIKKGIRKTSEKIIGKTATKGILKVGSGIKRLGAIIGAPFKAISKVLSAAKGFLMKVAIYALVALLIVALLAAVANALMSASSSIMFMGDENADKIDLSSYVDIVNDAQAKFESEINKLANGKGVSGEKYDNVFYDYNGTVGNNTTQIITMAYVRFGGLVDDYPDEVEEYIKQLYADSNYVDYTVSEPYKCDNGCVEREYKCYDSVEDLDPEATTTRDTLHQASDHYGTVGVGKNDKDRYGCEYDIYSCTIRGHGIYNKHGCKKHNNGAEMAVPCDCIDCKEETKKETVNKYYCQGYSVWVGFNQSFEKHNNGKAMDNPCSCGNYKTVEETVETEYYICQGYCPGEHKDYFCDGHIEKVCPGKHQDITITITSLDFDDIFYADSSIAELGSSIRGDAYEDKFVISAYCKCHDCCHVTESGKILCGGKDTANCKQMIANAKTASGVSPKANHTLAVDHENPVVPEGTHVYIDGKEYVVEDTGALENKGVGFDMYFDSHDAALQWGRRTKTVYKSKTVEDGSNFHRNIIDYLKLAQDATKDGFATNFVLEAFGQAKEPVVVWNRNRVNFDTQESFVQKLKSFDAEHENEEYTNVELNTFEYVDMSLNELKKLCKERGLNDTGSAYNLITEQLIPYDKANPDVFINPPDEDDESLYFAGWDEENIEFVKNYHKVLVSEEGDEIYTGLDGIKNLSYGVTNSTNYDFGDIVFDDSTGLTNKQQKILFVIQKNTLATVSGRCQAWVADVYQAALGGARNSRCCANHAGEAWGASNQWSDIQVGASVYGYSSSIYGHVGIYIGNGMVAHNIGYLKVQSLESWVNTYNGQCWGWNGGANLTGVSKYNCKAAGTFMNGND